MEHGHQTKFLTIIVFLLFTLFLVQCKSNPFELERRNLIITFEPTDENVLPTQATIKGEIIDIKSVIDGQIIDYGHVWSLNPSPTIGSDTNSYSRKGATLEPIVFETLIQRLVPGTAYYVRSYVKSSKETVYGNEIVFSTKDINSQRVIRNIAVLNIQSQSATAKGELNVSGNSNVVMEYGHIWKKNVTDASLLVFESNEGFKSNKPTVGTNLFSLSFTSDMSSLEANTNYGVRSYMKVSFLLNGVKEERMYYGDMISFKTRP